MNEFLPVIHASQLFSGIPDDGIAEMLSCLKAKKSGFPKGTYILRTGDTVDALGLILSGSALILQEDFWGNRNILSSIEQGQSFAETFACAPGSILNVSVTAGSPVVVLFLNVNRILTICPSACTYHRRFMRNLVVTLAEKNLNFNKKLTHMSQRTTRLKLLSYLSSQARHHGSPSFNIPFNRQQLADYLSVDRSGLSFELCKMRDDGLLDFNKNHFLLKHKIVTS